MGGAARAAADRVSQCADLERPSSSLAEAWTGYRHGGIDAATFGVEGTGNFGPAEISGNAIRDLAALNKVEMLPWDEWGRMTAAYAGQAGPGYDELIDEGLRDPTVAPRPRCASAETL